MAEESITLTQHWLGMRPYVLIEFFDGGEGDDDLRADVKAGAGIRSADEIRSAIELAHASLPGEENAWLSYAATSLQEYAVSHWDGTPASLEQVPVFAAVVLGDVARAARRVIEEDDPEGAEREAGRELGNLVLSSLRWMRDLDLEVTDCLEAAARSQAEYGQRSSEEQA